VSFQKVLKRRRRKNTKSEKGINERTETSHESYLVPISLSMLAKEKGGRISKETRIPFLHSHPKGGGVSSRKEKKSKSVLGKTSFEVFSRMREMRVGSGKRKWRL